MHFSEGSVSILLGFILSFYFTMRAIPIMHKKQLGQNIREEGPQSHQKKKGTPSMGGVAIILATVIATLAIGIVNTEVLNVLVCVLGFAAFGAIGFLDDYLKVIKKHNEGLKSYQKFALQFILATLFALYMQFASGLDSLVYIPFFKTYIDFGIFYIPFVIFTILAMSNGVNLTDGLDGLASGVTFIVAMTMSVMSLRFAAIPSWLFFSALAGACLGFLAFNKNPAKIFMGDTGSLAIGGGITVAAFLTKLEFILPIVGIIYVLETVSVILQVGYFKLSGGKRLFRMAPLHHHFEEGGMNEVKVVYLFWLISLIAMFVVLFFA